MVGFAAFFAGMKEIVDYQVSLLYTFVLVMSVLLGSAAWWGIVTGVTSIFRKGIATHTLRVMNLGSGALILISGVVFAVYAIWQAVAG